ncbi:universal stress protein [Massilia pinisoli]|uniref:Universal stress protein n=1 Tax=Massilia pinisoli TaxID=1772194 RepID=A0ABT1ZLI8_9BURK|nr:universal stress protein [Massilia pinisoli]MCS0580771.1 universal stress protein [Massilia pinisoli]
MDYKTIVVHVDESRHAPARIRYAARLAREHGALLLGAAFTGVSRAVFPTGFDIRPGTLEASCFEPLEVNARRTLTAFDAIAAEERTAHDTRLVCDQPDEGLARLARFADLVVVSRDDPDEAPAGSVVRLPDYVILNAARPVVIVPHRAEPPALPGRILLAWDGGKEASLALSASLPLLERASAVVIADLAGTAGGDFQAQLADVRAWLTRHGIQADTLLGAAARDEGGALLDLARAQGADLLVMGCYGHSRLRELCLGGASRTVLAEADIPVLLAH